MIICLKMWPLEHTQGFSHTWPSDLVFDLTWPISKPVWDFIETNILIVGLKIWPLECTQGFSKMWPSFWTRHNLFSNSSKILSRQTFWPSFMIIWLKMWPLERTLDFSKSWSTDLVFDLTWSIFKHVWDSSRQTFWPSFMIIGLKMWLLEHT